MYGSHKVDLDAAQSFFDPEDAKRHNIKERIPSLVEILEHCFRNEIGALAITSCHDVKNPLGDTRWEYYSSNRQIKSAEQAGYAIDGCVRRGLMRATLDRNTAILLHSRILRTTDKVDLLSLFAEEPEQGGNPIVIGNLATTLRSARDAGASLIGLREPNQLSHQLSPQVLETLAPAHPRVFDFAVSFSGMKGRLVSESAYSLLIRHGIPLISVSGAKRLEDCGRAYTLLDYEDSIAPQDFPLEFGPAVRACANREYGSVQRRIGLWGKVKAYLMLKRASRIHHQPFPTSKEQ